MPAAPPVSDPDLRAMVETLPYRQRTIVVLHYGHGLSLEEIARLLRAVRSYSRVRRTPKS